MINNFKFSPMPKIIFGLGKIKELPGLLAEHNTILLVTGGNSFKNTSHYKDLFKSLKDKTIYPITIVGEPTPEFVDNTVLEYKNKNIDVVVSIGGGSVMDCGKAISAMLTLSDSVMNYLEGFETKKHPGTKLPFIAVSTSSGTGSEMTKNAVLRSVGENGFKKSLRHDNFIPNAAILDPELTLSCPKSMTVACGLDAFTHLLESYLSTNSSPMTDALALSGIEHFSKGFINACFDGANNLESREHMAYASMLSGICLANAGLGTVHGYASAVGGYFEIPHGVVCATLLPPCTKYTIERLLEDKDKNMIYLEKYQKVGEILSKEKSTSVEDGCELLINLLYDYLKNLEIPSLSHYGVTENDFEKIIAQTGNKSNPIALCKDDLYKILLERL